MSKRFIVLLRDEWPFAASAATCLAFLLGGGSLLVGLSRPFWLAFVFIWLFAAMLVSAISVVRHAERLALQIGEPGGTLILTLSVTFVEAMSISAAMLHSPNNPTLTRDTLFAVVMIILNGMVGLSLLLGSWRRREQCYNLQGANAYLGVIIPLVILSLVLPDYTRTTAGPTLSLAQQAFLVLTSVGLYTVFLAAQTGRYSTYFSLDGDLTEHGLLEAKGGALPFHAVMLIAYMALVVFLAENLAYPIDYLIDTLGAPAPLGGIVIAVLVATPEAIGAVRAALADRLQRSVNIFLGSVLSTIGLTVPTMIVVGHFIGQDIVLGVEHTDLVMLLLTLAVSVVTFASGRTNIIQGVVHLILFGAYLLLVFQG